MIAVVQRVSHASVTIDGELYGQIGIGLAVLASVVVEDTRDDLQWMADKLVGLRVFDHAGKSCEHNVQQTGGAILLVSNFTIAAKCRRGRRPGFDRAMPAERADGLFQDFVHMVQQTGLRIITGKFGADMQIEIVNDGPFTLIVDSRADE